MECEEKWIKEKENLKLQFEALANKYVLFEDVDKTVLSDKLQKTFANTKEELHNLIKAL